ncbi:MAG: Sir2 family NAD-dependent protein deacetylase [Sporolactobacillus sp.]|uniref:SIR2 family NAD-dependent protein deacylase n=1 Tax=Sporolactobacillus sp. STSJ-5 TaxID=2965076 RepID=UPI002107B5BB|nr:Sir2 family NAD-dependent protein deacetylase [Sporolactobacillus sp. STSJ-5]MCQ2009118.1 NAD-dependent deacetylase [Sporolactobacillus sp. STSJ-5]
MSTLNEWIQNDHKIAVLTGAGISVPSGIPPFRGKNGLYQNKDVERCLTLQYFQAHPDEFWAFYWSLFDAPLLLNAKPNSVHLWLKNLEQTCEVTIITQNIDGLHAKAASSKIIEVHGAFNRCICPKCGTLYPTQSLLNQKIPHCSALSKDGKTCGTVLKPDIVLFGEAVRDLRAVEQAVNHADRLLVLGTSLGVAPINFLPEYAEEFGVPTLLINDRPALHMDAIDQFCKVNFANFDADSTIID